MGTRRANGEASIHEGKDGYWHGYVSMGVRADGRPDRRHVQGKTRAVVVRRIDGLRDQLKAGRPGDGGRPATVGVWLRHWLDNIAADRVRESTLNGYRSYVEQRLIPGIGAHRLDRLEPEHVEQLYRRLRREGMAPASVLQLHRILSRSLTVAVQRGRVTRNVCRLVDSPTLVRAEVEPLTAAEARRVLAAAEGGRNAARWSVALALGLRQGEALGLKWSDVDMDAGTLRVRRALQRQKGRHGCGEPQPGKAVKPRKGETAEPVKMVWPCGMQRGGNCPDRRGGGLVMVEPKSAAGRRTVVMPAELVEALRVHADWQAAERKLVGRSYHNQGILFADPEGLPTDPAADWRQWKSLLRQADVRDARLHDARHTAATLLLAQGVPARVVMQVLGHAQISLTLGTYSHVTQDLARTAADASGVALWGPTATETARVAPRTEGTG